jgi:hypothetical protein
MIGVLKCREIPNFRSIDKSRVYYLLFSEFYLDHIVVTALNILKRYFNVDAVYFTSLLFVDDQILLQSFKTNYKKLSLH